MSTTLLIFQSFGSWCTYGRYRCKYMLDFTPIWVFTSADYYSSMKFKYPTFYVNSYYFIWNLNWHIKVSKWWKEYPIFNVGFPLGKHFFLIKKNTRDVYYINVSTCVIYHKCWFLMYRCNIHPPLYVSFIIILGLYLWRLLFVNEG